MLRISDARMSGTSYGACILHVAPESAIGGPLAAVRTGDMITVDVPARSIHLHVDDAEIARAAESVAAAAARLSARLLPACSSQHIRQAMRAATSISSKAPGGIPEPEIH